MSVSTVVLFVRCRVPHVTLVRSNKAQHYGQLYEPYTASFKYTEQQNLAEDD